MTEKKIMEKKNIGWFKKVKKCFQEKKCHVWKRNIGEEENVMFEPNGKEKSWKKDKHFLYVKPSEKTFRRKKKNMWNRVEFFLCVWKK